MSILLIGMNHRTAPIKVREQLAFSREGVATALMLFRNQFPQSEAAIISTCNRVEMLVASEGPRPSVDDVVSFLAQARDIPVREFRTYLYQLVDEQAVRHLFRVASSLDSMMIGEYQIVNQLKTAYAQASEQGTTGRLLNRLFHQSFSVSKRIRTDTQIAERKVSVPSVAVDVARRIFSNLSNKHVLVIGAGEMAQLTCEHLRKCDATHFVVASRSLGNARMLAEACAGRAVPYDQMEQELVDADLVITATACPKPFLTFARMKEIQARRQRRPLFLIDLAVPRNIEPQVETLDQVYLYDVDALGRIVAENQQYRQSQVPMCEAILDREIEVFEAWLSESRARPLVQQMYTDARQLGQLELARLLATCPDLTPQQKQAVSQFTTRLVNKFMHPCALTLRQHSMSRPTATLAQVMHDLVAQSSGTTQQSNNDAVMRQGSSPRDSRSPENQ